MTKQRKSQAPKSQKKVPQEKHTIKAPPVNVFVLVAAEQTQRRAALSHLQTYNVEPVISETNLEARGLRNRGTYRNLYCFWAEQPDEAAATVANIPGVIGASKHNFATLIS